MHFVRGYDVLCAGADVDRRAQPQRGAGRHPLRRRSSDTDKNGSFESDDAVRTTIFSLTPSATSGPVGAEVTWMLDPAIAPVAFDANTTANWEGHYQPLVGPPTSAFSASYSAAQVRESSSTEAILVVGDGTLTNAPDPTEPSHTRSLFREGGTK